MEYPWGSRKRKSNCQKCSKLFEYYPSEQGGKYCSQICSGKIKDKIELKCPQCDRNFLTIPSHKEQRKFCSIACKATWQETHPAYVFYEDFPVERQLARLKNSYEKKVIKIENSCWGWKGSVDSYGKGYGRMNFRKGLKAHRASWMIHNGPIPDGLRVLHKCDNRICTNPEHLFLGTLKENSADAAIKGRVRKKLSKEQVTEIRRLLSLGIEGKKIAEQFNVSKTSIYAIKNHKSWNHFKEEK